jgi:hypothetical protein
VHVYWLVHISRQLRQAAERYLQSLFSMTYTKTTFEQMKDLPETIYKYRYWSNPFHQSIISEQIVFMARPSSFEDPFDCKLNETYEKLTDKEIYNKYFQDSLRIFPLATRQQHRLFARKWLKKTPLKDKLHLASVKEEYTKKFDDQIGVLSLTANPRNKSMWEKYADSSKGFCIGFNPVKMFKFLGGGGPVTYYDNLPEINALDDFDKKSIMQIFSKEIKWDFEEEYRTHKFWEQAATDNDRKIKITKECYKEIIFGANMPDAEREEIIKTCNKETIDMKFKVCVMEKDKIEIVDWLRQ